MQGAICRDTPSEEAVVEDLFFQNNFYKWLSIFRIFLNRVSLVAKYRSILKVC